MATVQTFADDINRAIKLAVEERVRTITKEETEKAQAAVELRMREVLAQVVLSTFKMYRVDSGHHEIIIRVENRS